MLRVVARPADEWNFQRGDMAGGARRRGILDSLCTKIGRDPASIVRAPNVPVSCDHPSDTRDAIDQALRRRNATHSAHGVSFLPRQLRSMGN